MMDDRRWADFLQKRDADFSYEIAGVGRFRVNAHFQRGTVALAIRIDLQSREIAGRAVSSGNRDQAHLPACAGWFWSPAPPAAARARRWQR